MNEIINVKTEPIHIISLGAGVQSSCMSLMAAAGEITPMPQCAIFADTQDEPASVYTWINWLEKQLPFPVIRCTRGSLMERCLTPYRSKKNNKMTFESIPAFVTDGIIPRQCTRDFKLDPINKAINKLRREHGGVSAIQWIGISTEEIWRAKEHRNSPRITNRYPLMEARMNRAQCLAWMERNGFPKPGRSACLYCPYRSNEEWRSLRDNNPDDFQRAIVFEGQFQNVTKGILDKVPYLHRSLKPLADVDLSTEEERGQVDMFNNECEGMCGV